MKGAALAVVLCAAACNPYETMPAPRCASPEHCLPGVACQGGFCIAQGEVALSVAAPVQSARAWIVATPDPDIGSWRRAPARLVFATAEPIAAVDGAAEEQLHELPVLPSWIIAWDGRSEALCDGVSYTASRIAISAARPQRAAVVLRAEWSGRCAGEPPPLGYADRVVFSSRRRRSRR